MSIQRHPPHNSRVSSLEPGKRIWVMRRRIMLCCYQTSVELDLADRAKAAAALREARAVLRRACDQQRAAIIAEMRAADLAGW